MVVFIFNTLTTLAIGMFLGWHLKKGDLFD